MKLRERVLRGSIKFKRREEGPTPLPKGPGAPPPPHDPILNTKDHEIKDNKMGDLPKENERRTGVTYKKNKEVLDIKEVYRLKTVKPR